ncbi:MAG: nucleotidyltransferase domain-containing protein [Chloroflexi bacterium]|nr:MAG: nucleotidyltransferase domain-containing protein [Chloroflexota bacterium]
MFTLEERDALRDRVLTLADEDRRIVAGAAVGSLAFGGGDRFSDLDLTFAVADDVSVAEVLDDWTRTLGNDVAALQLVDLERGPTVYRVFLLPDGLQFDLSLTPAARFAPAGPRFRLLFGETARGEGNDLPRPPAASDLFGWGVIYGLHARACIERGRVWQAEHYIGAVRDHALSLACLRRELPAVQARGYDDLPVDILATFTGTHVGSLEPERLRAALSAAMDALLHEAKENNVPNADAVAQRFSGPP